MIINVAVYFGWVAFASLVSFCLYGWDKRQAKIAGANRIPEKVLLTWDTIGGWPGGWFAQKQFHHKTRKQSYQLRYWMGVAVHCIAVAAVGYQILQDGSR